MKILNRTISAALAVSLILSSGMTAFADNSTQKEEVIYVMTDANGNTQNIYAVNIYGNGDVTDYGNYSAVKILNTDDNVSVNGDKVTFSSDSDKVYLQGDMTDVEIPWNIEIKYLLDGNEISADDLAGKAEVWKFILRSRKMKNAAVFMRITLYRLRSRSIQSCAKTSRQKVQRSLMWAERNSSPIRYCQIVVLIL